MGGEEKERPKVSKEYNKKTLRLMGEWVKKGVVNPQKGAPESEEEDEEDDEDSEGAAEGEETTIPTPSHSLASSSAVVCSVSHGPQLAQLEAFLQDLKDEQQKLGQNVESLAANV